jgi:hypothetical protein
LKFNPVVLQIARIYRAERQISVAGATRRKISGIEMKVQSSRASNSLSVTNSRNVDFVVNSSISLAGKS